MKNSFWGYKRKNGLVGIRNKLLIISITGLTGPTARKISDYLKGSLFVDNPYGGGIIGEDKTRQNNAIIGFAENPNVGAVLIISADPPKGDFIKSQLVKSSKPIELLTLDECNHDAIKLLELGLRKGAKLIREISRLRREKVSFSKLSIGLECGRSDPSSGLVANPLMGLIADKLIDFGGSAIIGETIEWLGAEHLLKKRAQTDEVKKKVSYAVDFQKNFAKSKGIDLLGNNPGHQNIKAGLSTIEEKSLGNIAKSGSKKIQNVIDWGEKPKKNGMYLMHAPSYAPESLSGFSSAGCQITLFSTGVGNSFNNHIAPSIKFSANPEACKLLSEQLDYKCADVFLGKKEINDSFEELWSLMIEICSGTETWGEILNESSEVFSRVDRSL
tara:strand:- start:401 stop:1561 length:1161 start_codon:yes stop_codon:yes gene_type:complete